MIWSQLLYFKTNLHYYLMSEPMTRYLKMHIDYLYLHERDSVTNNSVSPQGRTEKLKKGGGEY